MSVFKETVITVGREWNTRPNWATGSSFVFISIYAYCALKGYYVWLLPLAGAYYLSDYLDGHWARKGKHTVLGKILDPLRDHYCDLLFSFTVARTIFSSDAFAILAFIWFFECMMMGMNCGEWAKEKICGGFAHSLGKIGRQAAYVLAMTLFALYRSPYYSYLPSWSIFSSATLLVIMFLASGCAFILYLSLALKKNV